jgi:DNA-directed RNA polymerase specialized sigma24 family protein
MATQIAPLRKKKKDGSTYARPTEIESVLASLLQLIPKELVERVRIRDSQDADFVPTECLIYIVRNSVVNDQHAAADLFAELLDRVYRHSVPELTRREEASDEGSQSVLLLEVREQILAKFEDLLCNDQANYEVRLDFYECRFNAALAALRQTARRDVGRLHAGTVSLTLEEESNDLSTEVEEAFIKFKGLLAENDFSNYRFRLAKEINSLPADEKATMELLLQGLPIEAKDDQVTSIVKLLNCSEKTVRNRRDRAIKRLREALKEKVE